MRFGIDACCWSNRRGFGRFTRELVAAMAKEPRGHELTLVVDGQTAAAWTLPEGCAVSVVATSEQPTQAASADGSRSLRDLWRMGRAATAFRFDAFFFPAVYSYYPLHRRVPTVVTFHDAIAEEHPELIFHGHRTRLLWNAKTWMARRQADRILTVSESARSRLCAVFGYRPEQVHVATEAAGREFRVLGRAERPAIEATLAAHHLPADRPLVLYVGGISPHKNLESLIDAMPRLPADVRLALVGDHEGDSFRGCHADLVARLDGLGLRDRVTFTGFVTNDDLVRLYNAARVLVLPSLDEGFGLPVMEAMACGLPVAVSDRGSLPEVAGEAGVLFDPLDPAAIAAAVTRILGDPGLSARLVASGLGRAARSSWAAAARTTLDLLEDVAGHAAPPA